MCPITVQHEAPLLATVREGLERNNLCSADENLQDLSRGKHLGGRTMGWGENVAGKNLVRREILMGKVYR